MLINNREKKNLFTSGKKCFRIFEALKKMLGKLKFVKHQSLSEYNVQVNKLIEKKVEKKDFDSVEKKDSLPI